jgi:glycosyltransferase involved in cell wall biosynthesis
MKIVVNTRLLRKDRMDGIGWFTYNTMRHIVTQNPQIEFHFLFDSGVEKEFLFAENVTGHHLFPPAKHALLNVVWFEWSVKRFLNRIKPDLFLSPDGILCLGSDCTQYGVMHDINFFHHPEYLKFSNQKYYNYYFPKFAKKAARLGTVSEYSKQDICRSFKIPEDKIDVVYCGINSYYQPVDAITIGSTRNKYTGGKPYFIFIGTLSPRKNVLGLMKAYERFRMDTGLDMALMIVGGGMFKTAELKKYRSEMKFGADVVFTGWLNDKALNDVLASSLALVFVPFFEGFGIPLIEAMQCDVPIICSDVTSLPEVVADAALLVDPASTEEIKNAMARLATDPGLRKELIEKGRRRRTFFSWEKTSRLLWESIQKCF